jgi:hypothetical protein
VVGSGAPGFQIAERLHQDRDKSTSAWGAIAAPNDATADATTLVRGRIEILLDTVPQIVPPKTRCR